jgi:hypothetical protein
VDAQADTQPAFRPGFPAFLRDGMNYDSMVEEFFPHGFIMKGANALTPHRLSDFTPNCRKTALTTTFSSGMKA